MSVRLVLLHAFPLDGRMWDRQRELVPGRTETPTLYRYGDSLEAWAEEVLRTVGEGPLIVVGASMGGSCALEMARAAPERIAALVLVGAKAGHRREPALRDHCIAALNQHGVAGVWPEIRAQGFGQQSDPCVIDHIEALAREQPIDDLVRAMRVFHGRPDLTDVVKHWQKPLLAMCGESDGMVSEQKTSELVASAPQGQMHVMRGCGHYMNLERPAEFNQIVGGFVRSVESELCPMPTSL